ncbi:type II toxin-antitoxin system RelE/ParE family toxin [Phenylobacterium sp.]|uniref:type II toxin-antitoxin system RelE/ParE family toxin n=1 Tax=Phenylobacterium sp. TaxID=1871053 RepID=UPI0025DBDDA7|nr:type II toxin-antitoxin system RelE/ParE family toxin [Phenylobacterium sp.]MBX3484913.1 type II toxin-antitoxin system RelE/ParE family toxin [Phenylobacterium sp.]MCW5758425.1 type II toxin-antitoxin system RelE/ParE family toxin [Phenylobacterium sp.]
MKRVVFAEPAARDLEDIIDHIALDNPVAAERVYRAIVEASRRLARFPDLGRPGRFSGMRELSVTRLPYLIAYEADRRTVTILAVFHTSRDLARALAERRSGAGS